MKIGTLMDELKINEIAYEISLDFFLAYQRHGSITPWKYFATLRD